MRAQAFRDGHVSGWPDVAPGADTLSQIADMLRSGSEAEFLRFLRKAANGLGFPMVLHGVQLQLPLVSAEPIRHVTSGYPEAYQQLYAQRDFALRDPTVAHCLSSAEPIIWDRSIYSERSVDVMEESRRFGLGYGLSLPVPNPRAVSMLSLARDKPFASEAEVRLVLQGATVLAHMVHVVAQNIIVPDVLKRIAPRLSAQETECLKWVAAGKSNWAIGTIMNISEATAGFHVKNTLRKLNVSSRAQAVGLALILGLIN